MRSVGFFSPAPNLSLLPFGKLRRRSIPGRDRCPFPLLDGKRSLGGSRWEEKEEPLLITIKNCEKGKKGEETAQLPRSAILPPFPFPFPLPLPSSPKKEETMKIKRNFCSLCCQGEEWNECLAREGGEKSPQKREIYCALGLHRSPSFP